MFEGQKAGEPTLPFTATSQIAVSLNRRPSPSTGPKNDCKRHYNNRLTFRFIFSDSDPLPPAFSSANATAQTASVHAAEARSVFSTLARATQ